MSIDNQYKIPVDAAPNVHSVSAIGEQYLDLVSTGNPGQYYQNGQTITQRARCPARSAPRWTPRTTASRCCPRRRSTRC